MSKAENPPEKNVGGRPKKSGRKFSFYLADDVAEFLDQLNIGNTKGEQTKYVEEAVREKMKRDAKKTK